MKFRASTKIAVGFLAVCGLSYAGFRTYTKVRLSQIQLPTLSPGRVNFLAIAPDAGYRIVVANQIAQLWQFAKGSVAFEKPDDVTEDSSDIADRSRIPIAEMLKAMQGDAKALSTLVMAMNNIKEDDLPARRVTWSAEDIRQAIDGDRKLAARLESDLQMRLDGTPLSTFTLAAIEDGIVIEVPVPVRVKVGTESKTIVARIPRNFRPQFMAAMSKDLEMMGPDTNRDTLAGLYAKKVEALKAGEGSARKENLRASLLGVIDAKAAAKLAQAPQQILATTEVIATDAHTVGATMSEASRAGNQVFYQLDIELTPEGRDRLWKYSHDRIGSQILVIVDGIPVAAPRIQHEMFQTEIVINRLGDKTLAQDAADTINAIRKSGDPKI
jgi:hypothetical protein